MTLGPPEHALSLSDGLRRTCRRDAILKTADTLKVTGTHAVPGAGTRSGAGW